MVKTSIKVWVIIIPLFAITYILYITTDGIWIIFVIILFIVLLISSLICYLKKKHPKSKKLVKVLEKINEEAKQSFP